jgi:hypothetical protein
MHKEVICLIDACKIVHKEKLGHSLCVIFSGVYVGNWILYMIFAH